MARRNGISKPGGIPRVVIVGAGFGGLWAARALARARVDVLLVDRNNYHTFLPLLYQIAAAELSPDATVHPVRSILRKLPNVRFALAEVTRVDLGKRTVEAHDRQFPFDYLVLAPGSTPHYFGIPGADTHAFPLRVMADGITLRNHILSRFEEAMDEPSPERRDQLLTIVVVGGGPTGVEFAGSMAELIRGPLAKDYPRLERGRARVVLLEAADSLLPGLPGRLGDYARRRLATLGVEVRLRASVTRITPERAYLKDGDPIGTATVVWTAGHRGHPLGESSGLPVNRKGQVTVLPTLQVPGHPSVYVIGDMAEMKAPGKGSLPMVAPVAMQQGEVAARNVLRQVDGQEPEPFHFDDKGMLIVVGRNAAVARLGRRTFTGFFAWLLWGLVHIAQLIGFRNRLVVLVAWLWDYIFYERAVRLILPAEDPRRREAAVTDTDGAAAQARRAERR